VEGLPESVLFNREGKLVAHATEMLKTAGM